MIAQALLWFELFGGLSLWYPRMDSTFDASYTPSRVGGINSLFVEPDPRSSASQSLTLAGEQSWGLGLGANFYPHRVVGFQFLFDQAKVDLAGENPPHEVHLTYDTIAFPNPDRIVREVDYSFDSPDTQGTLDEWTLSFNAVARFGGSPVSGSVSGGLSYFRFEGEAERLGASAAYLGGHAVLFSDLYEMSYAWNTKDSLGFNFGGTLDLSLGPHAALFVDGRFLYAPETEVTVHLEELLSRNIPDVPLSQIEEFLDLPPLSIDPSYFRVLFGAKLKL